MSSARSSRLCWRRRRAKFWWQSFTERGTRCRLSSEKRKSRGREKREVSHISRKWEERSSHDEAEKGPGGKKGGIVLAPRRLAKNIFVCSECPLLSGCAMQINAFLLLLLPPLRGRLTFPEKKKKREEKSVDFRLSFRAKKKTSPLWTERVSRSNGREGWGKKRIAEKGRLATNCVKYRGVSIPPKKKRRKKKAGEKLSILQAIFILRNTAAIFL